MTGEDYEAESKILTKIKRGIKPNVILTTQMYAAGLNFFEKCYVVITQNPDSFNDLAQMMGRSNRTNKGLQNGAILLEEQCSKEDLIENLTSKMINDAINEGFK